MFKNLIIVVFLMITINACTVKDVQKKEAVRGVWLTNVDSEVLNSKKNIQEAVDLCDKIGLNSIFVVTWNKAMTTYPSEIMKEFTGIEIDTNLTGRDPLKELIDAAHAKKIKVFAWFEFGFSSSYQENGGILLKKRPEWASVDNKGKLVTKNGFEWMNGFHPEVQDFMLSLIMEVVNNYNIDGIQGDDRLPAMPSEAGYDAYTRKRYKNENYGKEPPEYYKDFNWVHWRAEILNDFMKRLNDEVRLVKPEMIITMAPSLYPWSKEEYLQDWPTWVRNGWVDLVIPQVYRYEFEPYCREIEKIKENQVEQFNLDKFYPGVLLKVGDYYPDEKFLEEMINENRKHGIEGEVFFFYEGLKKYPDFFMNLYDEKVDFPM